MKNFLIFLQLFLQFSHVLPLKYHIMVFILSFYIYAFKWFCKTCKLTRKIKETQNNLSNFSNKRTGCQPLLERRIRHLQELLKEETGVSPLNLSNKKTHGLVHFSCPCVYLDYFSVGLTSYCFPCHQSSSYIRLSISLMTDTFLRLQSGAKRSSPIPSPVNRATTVSGGNSVSAFVTTSM